MTGSQLSDDSIRPSINQCIQNGYETTLEHRGHGVMTRCVPTKKAMGNYRKSSRKGGMVIIEIRGSVRWPSWGEVLVRLLPIAGGIMVRCCRGTGPVRGALGRATRLVAFFGYRTEAWVLHGRRLSCNFELPFERCCRRPRTMRW